jgi:hypothetical protein
MLIESTIAENKAPEEGISADKIDQIEKEISRKLKKDRTLEGGMR